MKRQDIINPKIWIVITWRWWLEGKGREGEFCWERPPMFYFLTWATHTYASLSLFIKLFIFVFEIFSIYNPQKK